MNRDWNDSRDRIATAMDRARGALAFDAPGRALEHLLPVVESSNETRPSVLRLAATAAIRADDFDLARELVMRGLESTPQNIGLRILAMRLDFLDGDDDGAARIGNTLFALGVRRRPFLFLYADLLFALGEFERSLDVLVEALARHPMDQEIRTRLSHVAMAVENGDLGMRAMDALLQPPLLLQARLLARTGQWRDAVDAYDYIVLRPEPVLGDETTSVTLTEIELERLHALEQIGDQTRLVALAQAELESISTRASVRVRLAQSMVQFGLPLLAIRLAFPCRCDRQLADAAMATVAVAANLANRPTLAHRVVRRIRPANRTDALVPAWEHGLWGELMINQQSPVKAGADPDGSMLKPLLNAAAHVLDDAIDEHPDYADHYFNRANCLAELGLHVEAKHDLQKALELNPRYAEADRLLRELDRAA